MTVLEVCDIPNFVNLTELRSRMKQYCDSRFQVYRELKRNIKVEDDFADYCLQKATKGKITNAGNYPIDIQVNDKIGIDSCCLGLNKNETNEKSIIQNFKKFDDKSLDTLFEEKNGEDIIRFLIQSLRFKYNKIEQQEIYYGIFISNIENVYLVFLRVNLDKLNSLKCGNFTQKSLNIENFVDPFLGKTRIYQSKKRTELIFNKNIIAHSACVLIY